MYSSLLMNHTKIIIGDFYTLRKMLGSLGITWD